VTRGRRLAVAAAAVVALAAVPHWLVHYRARERAGRPGAEAVALLTDDAWRAALWIPYPHQNLAALEGRVGELRRLARDLADPGAFALQRFGPFALPPGRELAVAIAEDGRVRALERVYPTVAWIARAAGTVARNPWLAGGEIRDRGGALRATVAWKGTLWTCETVAPPLSAPEAQLGGGSPGRKRPQKGSRSRRGAGPEPGGADDFAGTPVLSTESSGVLALARGMDPLPRGLYRLARSGPGAELELVAGSPPAGSLLPAALVPPALTAPAGWIAEWPEPGKELGDGVAGETLRAMALWAEPGAVEGLPRLAALDRAGAERFSLPGEGLLRLIGERAKEAVAGPSIRVRALDRASLDAGVAFAGLLPGGRPADLLAAADPEALAPIAQGIADKLGILPGLAERERRGFERVAILLRALSGCAATTLEVGPGGSFARLVPCRGDVLDRGRSR
jgi:hypothetical protein